jgi:hypothetical protein
MMALGVWVGRVREGHSYLEEFSSSHRTRLARYKDRGEFGKSSDSSENLPKEVEKVP